jgi:hypothetical protein
MIPPQIPHGFGLDLSFLRIPGSYSRVLIGSKTRDEYLSFVGAFLIALGLVHL